ncbi:hypothetical protein PF010_g31716, partial [Phytophthora fragariae]
MADTTNEKINGQHGANAAMANADEKTNGQHDANAAI